MRDLDGNKTKRNAKGPGVAHRGVWGGPPTPGGPLAPPSWGLGPPAEGPGWGGARASRATAAAVGPGAAQASRARPPAEGLGGVGRLQRAPVKLIERKQKDDKSLNQY